MNNHLSPQQMLAFVDGELSKAEMQRAEDHLHSCWTCLTEVERLKGDIATILDAQNEKFLPGLPPPPRPWANFHALVARSLPEPRTPLWVRLGAYLNNVLSPVRLLVVSGVIAVLVVFGYSFFRAKTVSAQEVLRRIQVADTQRSVITKDQVIRERVHIRKSVRGRKRTQLASLDTWKSPTAAYWNVEDDDSAASDLQAQYKAHDIPAGLPLSAAAVDSWGKAAGGAPTVSQQGSDMDLSFDGSGDGTAGSVERVSLVVQPDTWQVKQMTLDFADVSFEVTEDDYSVMPTSAVPTELLAHLEPEALPSMPLEPVAHAVTNPAVGSIRVPAVNLDKAELDVFATLHGLKADLGEPVTVSRSSQAVHVGVWELPPERQSELRAALSEEPGVQVELSPPRVPLRTAPVAQSTAPPASYDSPLPIVVESGDDDQRLLKFFGTPETEQNFTNEALATSTVVLSHLYALKNLQEQFPPEKSQSLTSDEQMQLRSLVQDHLAAISANIDALGSQFQPLDVSFHVTPCTSSTIPPTTNWQAGSLQALDDAKEIDHLLRALLTTSQSPAVPDSALPAIDRRLCRLRTELKNLTVIAH